MHPEELAAGIPTALCVCVFPLVPWTEEYHICAYSVISMHVFTCMCVYICVRACMRIWVQNHKTWLFSDRPQSTHGDRNIKYKIMYTGNWEMNTFSSVIHKQTDNTVCFQFLTSSGEHDCVLLSVTPCDPQGSMGSRFRIQGKIRNRSIFLIQWWALLGYPNQFS